MLPYVKNVKDPVVYVEKALECQKDLGGFKLFAFQAPKHPLNKIWDYILSEKFHIIMITRENLLNRYLSHLLVKSNWQEGVPHPNAFVGTVYQKSVRIDPEKCILDIEKQIEEEKKLFVKFSNNPFLHITYENLTKNENSYKEILDFLGLEWREPKTNLQRQRVKTQQEMIENYWELKDSLKDTPYIKFFDESESKLFL
jgi:hypothetical protein